MSVHNISVGKILYGAVSPSRLSLQNYCSIHWLSSIETDCSLYEDSLVFMRLRLKTYLKRINLRFYGQRIELVTSLTTLLSAFVMCWYFTVRFVGKQEIRLAVVLTERTKLLVTFSTTLYPIQKIFLNPDVLKYCG